MRSCNEFFSKTLELGQIVALRADWGSCRDCSGKLLHTAPQLIGRCRFQARVAKSIGALLTHFHICFLGMNSATLGTTPQPEIERMHQDVAEVLPCF